MPFCFLAKLTAGLACLFLATATEAALTTLYSGNALPTAEGWNFVPLGPATPTLLPGGGGVQLDTSAGNGTYAGYFQQFAPGTLSSPNEDGFTVFDFRVGVTSDTYSNPLRAGMSLLVLNSAGLGIEIGIHSNELFVQGPGFATTPGPAELRSLDLTTPRSLQIYLYRNHYRINLEGDIALLGGTLKDYSGYPTPFGPIYSSRDFIFFGDNTSSAGGVSQFRFLTMEVIPEPTAAIVLAPACALLVRRRQA